MTRSERSNIRFVGIVLETVGWPLFWGVLGHVRLLFCLATGLDRSPDPAALHGRAPGRVRRDGPVLYRAGRDRAAWMVGHAAAGDHRIGAAGGSRRRGSGAGGSPISCWSSCPPCRHPLRRSAIVRRLEAALAHVRRQESADQLDEELKYLADVEAERTYEAYALVRIIIWATPMLGFLGTVIGITLALGDLSPEALVNSPKEAMEGLLSGLSVAFDTTALALTLSMLLMFAQFLANQLETQLLSLVDRRRQRRTGTPFPPVGYPARSADCRRPADVADGDLRHGDPGRRQSEVWKTTMDQAHEQWQQLVAKHRQLGPDGGQRCATGKPPIPLGQPVAAGAGGRISAPPCSGNNGSNRRLRPCSRHRLNRRN